MFRSFAALLIVLSFLFSGAAMASEITVNKIAATVNGEMITLHELQRQTGAELARQNMAPSDPRAPVIMQSVLEAMINDILIRQEAGRWKITVSDNEVNTEIRNILQRNRISMQAYEQQLSRQGATLAQVKTRIHDTLLRQRMMSLMIARKVVVTKEEISTYYEAHREEFGGQKQVDFSVILFHPGVKAQKIFEDLKSGSIGFEEAAQKYSRDVSAKNGGHIGNVPLARLSPNMRDRFSSMSPGSLILEKTEGGDAIFRMNSLSDGKPQTLEEASRQIEEILREPRLQERFREYAQQLRAKAVIDIRI